MVKQVLARALLLLALTAAVIPVSAETLAGRVVGLV